MRDSVFDVIERYNNKYKAKLRNAPSYLPFLKIFFHTSKFVLASLFRREDSDNTEGVQFFSELDSFVEIQGDIKHGVGQEFSSFYPIIERRTKEVRYDITNILNKNRDIKTIGLVFFMGVGDYILSINFLKQLKNQFQSHKIHAFISSSLDQVNSPLVYEFAKSNRIFEKISLYNGKDCGLWLQYDYSECLDMLEPGTILLPVVYTHNAGVSSRTFALQTTFGLPHTNYISPPRIHSLEARADTSSLSRKIAHLSGRRTVVIFQFEGRSSNYRYKYAENLAEILIGRNYFIVSMDDIDIDSPYIFKIDKKCFSFSDSINFIESLKTEVSILWLSIASVSAPLSAALGVRHVVMQHFYDESIASYTFLNHFVITPIKYSTLAARQQFLANPSEFEYSTGHNKQFHFSPKFVADCVDEIASSICN